VDRVQCVFTLLAKAETDTVLPAVPNNEAELEAALLEIRHLPSFALRPSRKENLE
jgi:hypothetical protein